MESWSTPNTELELRQDTHGFDICNLQIIDNKIAMFDDPAYQGGDT